MYACQRDDHTQLLSLRKKATKLAICVTAKEVFTVKRNSPFRSTGPTAGLLVRAPGAGHLPPAHGGVRRPAPSAGVLAWGVEKLRGIVAALLSFLLRRFGNGRVISPPLRRGGPELAAPTARCLPFGAVRRRRWPVTDPAENNRPQMSAKAKSLITATSLFFRLSPRAVTSPEVTSTHHGAGAGLVSSAHAAIVPSERGGQAGAIF